MKKQNANTANRLADAMSPYLLQHAHNPVDWYEWGPEALNKARQENKPIFLSIGYSACHWCHVMAHESFEDDSTAALMNEYFVNIKIDREERPDLDELYMRATIIYTRGNGGWPMSVWLTPDLKPFAAGTYFPPEPRYGRPSFKEVCEKIHESWTQRRTDIDESAEVLTRVVRQSLAPVIPPSPPVLPSDLEQTVKTIADAFDDQHGGIMSGGTNKFPASMILDLMLRVANRQPKNAELRKTLVTHVTNTLDKMAAGGIRDHLGGGFARYSTDLQWHVPHFEKMLYDQALISGIYVDAYRFTHNEKYAAIAREVFDYVLYDLQSADGGFYSARDADSDGGEGTYYVWTRNEALITLDAEDADLIADYYDLQPTGNWKDLHAPNVPKNICRTPIELETFAQQRGLSVEALKEKLRRGKEKLLAAREERVPPSLDTKILAEWNGLMITSLAEGGTALSEPEYTKAAEKAADFVWSTMYADGRLCRSCRHGRTSPVAFLGDYAAMIEAFLTLYSATFKKRYLDAAVELNNTAIQLFWDDTNGGFFFTPSDHEPLLARPKEINDGAIPSGNAIQLTNLLKLSTILGDDSLKGKANRLIEVFGGALLDTPTAGPRFLCGVDSAIHAACEVVIVGPTAHRHTHTLTATAAKTYVPNLVLIGADPENREAMTASPLLRNRQMLGDLPTAYVCRAQTCLPPTDDEAMLRRQLKQL